MKMFTKKTIGGFALFYIVVMVVVWFMYESLPGIHKSKSKVKVKTTTVTAPSHFARNPYNETPETSRPNNPQTPEARQQHDRQKPHNPLNDNTRPYVPPSTRDQQPPNKGNTQPQPVTQPQNQPNPQSKPDVPAESQLLPNNPPNRSSQREPNPRPPNNEPNNPPAKHSQQNDEPQVKRDEFVSFDRMTENEKKGIDRVVVEGLSIRATSDMLNAIKTAAKRNDAILCRVIVRIRKDYVQSKRDKTVRKSVVVTDGDYRRYARMVVTNINGVPTLTIEDFTPYVKNDSKIYYDMSLMSLKRDTSGGKWKTFNVDTSFVGNERLSISKIDILLPSK